MKYINLDKVKEGLVKNLNVGEHYIDGMVMAIAGIEKPALMEYLLSMLEGNRNIADKAYKIIVDNCEYTKGGLIGMVVGASIEHKKGTRIEFISPELYPVLTGDMVAVEVQYGETKTTATFEIEKIEYVTGDLKITAIEKGYYNSKLDRKPNFNLRSIIQSHVVKIIDPDWIRNINAASCLC
jgi:hypothetical protein